MDGIPEKILTTGLTTVVIGVVYALLSRSAAQPAQWADDEERVIELVHGTFVRKVIPWSIGLVATAALVLSLLALMDDEVAAACIGGALAIAFGFGAWMLVREGGQRLRLDPELIRWTRSPGREESLRWDDVRDVRFSAFWNSILLRGRNGERIRVSMFFRGFDLFIQLTRRQLKNRLWKDAFDKLARMKNTPIA